MIRSNVGRYFSSIESDDNDGDFDNVHGQQKKCTFFVDFFDETEELFPIVKSLTYSHLKEDIIRKKKKKKSIHIYIYVYTCQGHQQKEIPLLFVTRFIDNCTNPSRLMQ